MSCVFISVLTDIFYLISFESSAFHRGSNLFPLVYQIAEVKGFKSILKLLSKKSKKLVNTNFRVYLFLQAEKACISRVLILQNGKFLKISPVLIFANGKFLKILSLQISAPRKKRIRKKQLNQGTFG